MSETAAATAPATSTHSASAETPSLSDVKGMFAEALNAAEEATEAEPEGQQSKPERAPDGKFKGKDKQEPDKEPGKKLDEEPDPEDKPPTNGERAKFRAERRALKQREAELAKAQDSAARMFHSERAMWVKFHAAKNEGRALEAIQALGFDVEELAKQLSEQAMGNDPRLSAMQRQMAEMEAQRERERRAAEERQAEAELAQANRRWNSMLADTLSTSGDETLAALAKEPDLIDWVRTEQERAFEEDVLEVGADEARRRQRSPAAMIRAARVVAREAHSSHTRLGRLFRKVADEAESETGAEQPSAPGELKTRGKSAPRSLGASQGAAKPRQPATFDTSTAEGKRAWKAHYEAMLKNSTD